ncbi:TolC family type I secretion outer membrane protein [Novosphingobium nitrogenifigens DSM 19370]|uniref:TolC family type I secretion outer membrane protein n=1 Tax=Novosphingobium nitrogenifigens DSM 19370 TaxID=983920 RepID=F1Z6H2_9SPHN|nr:TolC family protein [Novosphingobium nitrogenifigens]EGD59632.1 TolC family type I secretion outer membrane protein [Novosphingobium nitrogenifigens DSM 19370]
MDRARRILRLAALPALLLPGAALADSLTSTIADALAHAPALAEAQAGVDAAKARLDGAHAQSMPTLGIEGQVGAGRLDNGGFFGFTARNVTPLALRAGAELPIYAGGRVAAAIDQAHGGQAIAALALADARSRTTVDAVAAYAEVLTARRIETRWQQTDGELAEIERQAALRFKAGEIPQSDLSSAKARRAEGTAGLAAAQGRRIVAEARYRRLTGHDAGQLDPLPALPAIPPTLDEAIDTAHRSNPVLAQAERAVDVAKAGVRGAKAEGMPVIGAFAEASRTRDQFFPDYRADSMSVGVRGRWTLFNGGRTAAKIHEADAGLDASEARARDAREAIDSAVIDAWTGLHSTTAMVEAGHARAAAAAEALRSTRLEAKVGEKPTLAVLDAEREATGADAAAIEAEGQQLVAAWQLNALAGALTP